MSEHRNRNYSVAVLLILLGVGLLLQQLGVWQVTWAQVWRLWPLALVLIGLEMLLQRVPLGGLIYLLLVVAILALVWFAWPGLVVRWGTQETLSFERSLDETEWASLEISMGVGQLEIGALREPGLLYRGHLRHDASRSELLESAEVRDGRASVSLRHTGVGGGPLVGGDNDRLELALSPVTPLALNVNTGVSRARLDLASLELIGLDLRAGVGEVRVSLPKGSYEATIQGGVGALLIELPEGAGVRIEVDEGLGAVRVAERFRKVGDGWESAGPGDIRVHIRVGVGAVTVR